jgi:pimeloyl-ACP methyl ester carboxylesterase
MTIAAAHLRTFGIAEAAPREPRELTALARAKGWLNSPPLTSASLDGKVVLVEFWTYTCINWLRTLPYVRAWAQKDLQGLVVIGVQIAEFPIERDVVNVRRAMRQVGIEYPVVLDNDYSRRHPRQHHDHPADQHGGSGRRLYWQNKAASFFAVKGVSAAMPDAVSVFPDELYPAPRSWAERVYPKLIHYNKVEQGGHFATWEQPQLFCDAVRAGFRSLRN